jgi:chemotaxis protein methyltransferase CheR
LRADALSTPRWHRLSELIAARTGLHFPPERHVDLLRALAEAAPEFGCRDAEDCADWLLNASLSAAQLRTLARHLTIGETYFLRERPSFNALATEVMPALIRRNRDRGRRLRLWSAACSTGEEAYSLAMLVQQTLPDWRDWKVTILATDLNPQSLRKAEAGEYGEWSFRDCPTDLRERFFTPLNHGAPHRARHRVRDDLREMVTFAELNLASDTFPGPANDTHAMDLILCRNLLIYFTAAHGRRLIASLRQSLVDGGWLVVSPSECSQALFAGFEPVNFPGSILYRKHGALAPVPQAEFRQLDHFPATQAAAPATLTEQQVAEVLAPDDEPARLAALGLLARSLANQGLLDQALSASETWIAADKLDAAAHYLHAMVLQELGERPGARAALQRAVYLQPEFTLAHFALGNLARTEARTAEARRHFANAARLLRGVGEDQFLPESEGLTAGRLREIIKSLSLGTDS